MFLMFHTERRARAGIEVTFPAARPCVPKIPRPFGSTEAPLARLLPISRLWDQVRSDAVNRRPQVATL